MLISVAALCQTTSLQLRLPILLQDLQFGSQMLTNERRIALALSRTYFLVSRYANVFFFSDESNVAKYLAFLALVFQALNNYTRCSASAPRDKVAKYFWSIVS